MWVKALNVKSDTPNLIEENMGNTLECINTGDYFLNKTQMSHTLRLGIDKCDLLSDKG